MKASTFTDGNFYITTWVDDGIMDVSQVSVGDAGLSHVIEVQQGVTHVQDVRVVGRLPQGVQSSQVQYLAFTPAGNREVTWSDTALGLVNGSTQPLKCNVEVVNSSGNERVQCSQVEYTDHQLHQTFQCSQGLPLEISITIQ